MIDLDGYRPNVGIILSNKMGQVFWAKRIGQNAWQFPQGGIDRDETPEQAMYRELWEEVGLLPKHVSIIGSTQRWLKYRLPKHLIRHDSMPLCIGQKQRWFLLRMECEEGQVCFDSTKTPEFDGWRWVDYWYPADEVVFFKRRVYRQALEELASGLRIDRDPDG
ncbi:MAG TPA: RNA pyrophosphohydrolase [Gammaproteobacteria bacterium]|nr:RNA pyrophosphohydrolase [Gammaproteobacteria bacterium]